MANVITNLTTADGSRYTVILVQIVGDASGEETDTSILDASGLSPASTNLALARAKWALNGFDVTLKWDATANVRFFTMSGADSQEFQQDNGSLSNNAGAGKTGDVVFDSSGLGAEDGYFELTFIKKG